MRVYLKQNVLEAATARIEWLLDRYANIVVSLSGGKDSTMLADLVCKRAAVRGRQVHIFFLDQEAEYQSTIEVIGWFMDRPEVIPHWYQVPIFMTSAASYEDDQLYAWGLGETWMRDKDSRAIHQIDGAYPQRFYPFIDWFEAQWTSDTAFLVGLRAEESLNRYRAVIKHPALPGIYWSSRGANHVVKFYPIYDWSFDDIFHYFYRENVPYNRIYDFLHAQDTHEQITKYRVSNLIHEKAYRSLATLQAFEHDTYERLCRRMRGVRTAARYAEEQTIYHNGTLPASFASWRAYRDHLLATIPPTRRAAFERRFARQDQTERRYRHQVKQLLINDWENSVPATSMPIDEDWRTKWMELL